jgi:dTDP-4-dehydrorhamnose 3,5-epimerase
MKFDTTVFSDLLIITPNYIGDERGWFMRIYSEDLFKNNIHGFDNKKWVQSNHSYSKEKYTWRGLHFQKKPFQETKLVRCISGSVIDFVVDIRADSKTFLKYFEIELSSINKKMIYIPAGFAHGFFTLEDNTEMIYLHDKYYNAEFESGLNYRDPLINLKLPYSPNVVSQRDENHLLLNKNFKGI